MESKEGNEEESMSLYKRGRVWWYRFEFQGSLIRESTGLSNKEAARAVEDKRHTALRESRSGFTPQLRSPLFSKAAEDYLKAKRTDWAPKTAIIEKTNLAHLTPVFGNRLLSDIGPDAVSSYRDGRRTDGAAKKTISLELGTLRAILIYKDLDANWRLIRKKLGKFSKVKNVGRAITMIEQSALLPECRASRSRSLYVAVMVALETCVRYSELRLLKWLQVDFAGRTVTVGKSKTDAGEGRVIPLTTAAIETLTGWAVNFPDRKPNHYVFPSEHYGQPRLKSQPVSQGAVVYDTDPTKPITTWKEGWEHAKARAGVQCRWHDLRHTGCTRLLDAGVSHPIVAEIMGWSASTAIRMIKEVYGHIGLPAKQRAMQAAENFSEPLKVGTESSTIEEPKNETIQ
jgi:integrase